VLLYQLLGSYGMPTFYDKLLQVPLLNLSVRAIDRVFRSTAAPSLDRKRHLAYMAIWGVVFVVMSFAQGVGDSHPGQWLPFWRQACQDGRPYACPYLADLQLNYCDRGSGWSCNEAGLLHVALSESGEDTRRLNLSEAADPLSRGCLLGFDAACRNLTTLKTADNSWSAPPPTLADYPIILKGSKGEVREQEPSALFDLACRQGWPDTCGKHEP
jgi:hypothetical protein